VAWLAERAGLSIAKASQHLRLMRGADLLASRRDGKRIERDALEPVSRKELARPMKDGLVTVLDVRTEDEFAAGHLPRPATAMRRRGASRESGAKLPSSRCQASVARHSCRRPSARPSARPSSSGS
jgi:DNA-binding transcriptional ArsR family regulator